MVDSFLKQCDVHPTDRVSLAGGIPDLELDLKHLVPLDYIAAHLDPPDPVLQLPPLELLMLPLYLVHQLYLLLQLLGQPLVVLREILIRHLLPLQPHGQRHDLPHHDLRALVERLEPCPHLLLPVVLVPQGALVDLDSRL